MRLAAREEMKDLGVLGAEDESHTRGILAATKTHLKLSKQALQLYRAIKNSGNDEFVDVEESLAQISFQALENHLFWGVPLDDDTLTVKWAGFDSGSGRLDGLPDNIWLPMRNLWLDLVELQDRRADARKLLQASP